MQIIAGADRYVEYANHIADHFEEEHHLLDDVLPVVTPQVSVDESLIDVLEPEK